MFRYAKCFMTMFAVLSITASMAYTDAPKNIVFIFDASGSMESLIGSRTKISILKDVLGNAVRELPQGMNVGLVAFGHHRQGDCNDVEELAALGPVDKKFFQKLDSLQSKGMTAISLSLRKAAERLKGVSKKSIIVIIADGQDDCRHDPCETVREIRKQGLNFNLYAIGFDIKEDEGRQLSCMTKAGEGAYFAAENGDQLKNHLKKIFELSGISTVSPNPPAPFPEREWGELPSPLRGGAGGGVKSAKPAESKEMKITAKKDRSREHRIKEIQQIRTVIMPNGEEKVVFLSDEFYSPKVYVLKEAVPKVVCDFSNAHLVSGIASVIKVNGRLIKTIRIGKHGNLIRVVLDLSSVIKYRMRQESSKAENTHTLILSPE